VTGQPNWQPQPPQQKKNRTNLFAVLGLVLVLVIGGVAAIIVANSGEDTPPRAAAPEAPSADTKVIEARDEAFADGVAAAEVLSTLSADDAEADLDRWESVATGALLTDIQTSRAAAVQRVRETGSSAKGTVLSAALAELDADRGTAKLLAATRQDVTTGGSTSEKRTRAVLSLVRTDDGWKVEAINNV
jgi:Mce-associated membrane protein